jgi:nitrile hydratase subunit alpha
VLAEMGLEIGEDAQITVHDSSSEVRWFVLPERPAGTESLSEEQLTALITREAMVGVARVQAPLPRQSTLMARRRRRAQTVS